MREIISLRSRQAEGLGPDAIPNWSTGRDRLIGKLRGCTERYTRNRRRVTARSASALRQRRSALQILESGSLTVLCIRHIS